MITPIVFSSCSVVAIVLLSSSLAPILAAPIEQTETTQSQNEYQIQVAETTTSIQSDTRRQLKTVISLKRDEKACICLNVGDWVITDREFEHVLGKLREEAIREALAQIGGAEGGKRFIDQLNQLNLDGVDDLDAKIDTSEDHKSSCPICLEDLGSNDDLILQCEHKFHTECLRKWIEKRQTCPICGGMARPRFRIRQSSMEPNRVEGEEIGETHSKPPIEVQSGQ